MSGAGGAAEGNPCSKRTEVSFGRMDSPGGTGGGDGCTSARELNDTGFIISNMGQVTDFTLCVFYCNKNKHTRKPLKHRVSISLGCFIFHV